MITLPTSLHILVCSLMVSPGTIVAPICCVIPPASPSCTFECRIISRILVLPVSTCPKTQTTGQRRRSVVHLLSASTFRCCKENERQRDIEQECVLRIYVTHYIHPKINPINSNYLMVFGYFKDSSNTQTTQWCTVVKLAIIPYRYFHVLPMFTCF